MTTADITFGVGLVTAQRPPWDARSQGETFWNVVDLCGAVEESGIDAVWFPEHHFFDDSYLCSVFPLLGAVAQATSTLRMGTAVLPAHFHDPLRLAEDASTVDLLSDGRLLLGLGHGWRRAEFRAFGTDQRQLGTRLERLIDTLRTAWSADGEVRGTAVTPKPSAATGVPVWIEGTSAAQCRRAGTLADGFISPSASTEQATAYAALVAEGAAAAGRQLDGLEFGVLLPGFPWSGPDLPASVSDGVQRVYSQQYARMADQTFTPPSGLAAVPQSEGRADEDLQETETGGPHQVAESVAATIRAVRTAIPTAKVHVVARSWWPGVSPAVLAESARVFAREVVPAVLSRCWHTRRPVIVAPDPRRMPPDGRRCGPGRGLVAGATASAAELDRVGLIAGRRGAEAGEGVPGETRELRRRSRIAWSSTVTGRALTPTGFGSGTR